MGHANRWSASRLPTRRRGFGWTLVGRLVAVGAVAVGTEWFAAAFNWVWV